MNIGEKISLYKDKLGFKNYQDFGKAVGVNGSWLLELSKKTEVSFIDLNNLLKICRYLGITIDQLVNDDHIVLSNKTIEVTNINANCDDIGVIIDEIEELLSKEGIKIDGMLMNEKSKEICKHSLEVVKTLTRQHL